ncbi:hypothetical protein [Nostoc sp. 'Peltigera malacea cyanobiont' DB3992]|uniref:hypothetical protein n=1 Tax=Nostoc sp. 'Peltigera malacea cyanobiont' DB3992 TaxID=1206980 RepID=UPI000C03D5E8|nr:hypothetical protein [Nostoc sp. 'Peltigera malacea cyanobiont' DB3992]PHM09455.1 hypothetical protein CK516_14435 [Nostoc sp. 'Peltigera malacea cyanobiont' DB3992]
MDNQIIKDLLAFATPFYLAGDFDNYDDFNMAIAPLMSDDLRDKYSEGTKKLEKSNPEILKKYVEYFSYKYEVPLDNIWACYDDKPK